MAGTGSLGPRRSAPPSPTTATTRPPDLVDRQFAVPTPNILVVADFTYVRLSTVVFVYTAFAIDAFAGRTRAGSAVPASTPRSWSQLSARLPASADWMVIRCWTMQFISRMRALSIPLHGLARH